MKTLLQQTDDLPPGVFIGWQCSRCGQTWAWWVTECNCVSEWIYTTETA